MLNCAPMRKILAVYRLVQIIGLQADLQEALGDSLQGYFNGNITQDYKTPQSLET